MSTSRAPVALSVYDRAVRRAQVAAVARKMRVRLAALVVGAGGVGHALESNQRRSA